MLTSSTSKEIGGTMDILERASHRHCRRSIETIQLFSTKSPFMLKSDEFSVYEFVFKLLKRWISVLESTQNT
jgi:hypothetical protein